MTADAAAAVRAAFDDAAEPKALRFFPGREHSRGMLRATHGEEVVRTIVDFVAEGLA